MAWVHGCERYSLLKGVSFRCISPSSSCIYIFFLCSEALDCVVKLSVRKRVGVVSVRLDRGWTSSVGMECIHKRCREVAGLYKSFGKPHRTSHICSWRRTWYLHLRPNQRFQRNTQLLIDYEVSHEKYFLLIHIIYFP